MKSRIALALLASVFLIFGSMAFPKTQSAPYSVHGRAVDAKGQPVRNALIAWNASKKGGGGAIELGTSDELGRFALSIPRYMKSEEIRLFVTTEMPDKTSSLLSPPFITEPREFADRYAGPKIILDEQTSVDVGDVPIKMVFLPVTLTILDKKGEARLNTAKLWSKVIIRLLDIGGRPITSSTISERDISVKRTVNFARSQVNIALPEGSWRIEVSIGNSTGPFFGRAIRVSRSNMSGRRVTINIPDNLLLS